MNRARVLEQVRQQVRGRDVALGYGVIVIVVSVVAAVQPHGQLRSIVMTSSTDLTNLRQRPLGVLFASAFVISPASGLWIVAPMVVAYGALERWLGRASVILVAMLGHVGATLFVATMEITELAKGRVGFRIALSPDVGVSYGLAAVAAVLIVRVGDRWRRRYVVMSLVVVVGQFFILRNFTGLGHVTAWLIGLAVAVPISRHAHSQHHLGLRDPR
jgi:hypothetical protein